MAATTTSSGFRPGPSRLPSRPPARTERRREVRNGVLAVAGLLVVLVGVPAALVLLVGNPLPSSLPDRDTLTAPVTATTLIKVLGAALWLAWAHFAVCVLAEGKAARRGRGVPTEVPLGGGSQALARRLVAATLLLAGAATLLPSGAAPTAAPAAPTSGVSISQSVQAVVATPVADPQAAQTTTAAAPTKTYVVQPPNNRRYDTLWDIAERTLGDPLRYREIYALNHDRVQDDGRKLVDADLIHPGWVLQMPGDATGPGITTPALAPPQRAPQAPPAGQPTAGAEQATTAGQTGTVQAPVQEQGLGLERMLLGGGLLAAGVLVALSARRGPFGARQEQGVEPELRLASTPGRADLLDRALRTLAASCAEQARPLPEVAVAYLDDTELVLSLIGTAGSPPAPWRSVSDGRGWAVTGTDLAEQSPDVAAPYPALAGLGLSEGADVLVDLEAAPGVIGLQGDGDAAREAALSLMVELATNLWSDGVEVTAVGFGDDLGDVRPGRVTAVDHLASVLDALESEARSSAAALRALGVEGVLSGRLVRGAARRRPRVVVLSGPPTEQEAARLEPLVRDVRTPLAVVGVGAGRLARWTFQLDAQGGLDLGVLGVRCQARRLPREGFLALLDALRGADTERAHNAGTLASLSPAAALIEVTGAGQGAPLPELGGRPAPVVRQAPQGTAAVRVQLLGPVQVLADGPVDSGAQALLSELVVAVALHRASDDAGVHEAVLRAEVWPRGVGDDVLAATLRQAQAWLGSGSDGRSLLYQDGQGRWTLTADVHTDWDVLQAAAAAPAGAQERPGLEQALALVRGEAFSATDADRFASLTFHRAARDARVVGTAVARRAAGLAGGAGDRTAAVRNLRAGLSLVPAAEVLWRDLLRLLADDADAAGGVAREAYAALAAHGLRAEAETDALVAQVLPAFRRAELG